MSERKQRRFHKGIKIRNGHVRGAFGSAVADTSQPTLVSLMKATRKPRNTSEVRWRIELARRADPLRYALAGTVPR